MADTSILAVQLEVSCIPPLPSGAKWWMTNGRFVCTLMVRVNFHYINNAEEFLKLVVKDDVVIKITGKEKIDVVNALYTGLLKNVKGTAYTLIRVAARTNMDAVFAHYVGAMAEAEDGNDDFGEY